MGLNKKQKKQIDVARKKILNLQQRLSAARQQPDDPAEIPELEQQIQKLQQDIENIQKA